MSFQLPIATDVRALLALEDPVERWREFMDCMDNTAGTPAGNSWREVFRQLCCALCGGESMRDMLHIQQHVRELVALNAQTMRAASYAWFSKANHEALRLFLQHVAATGVLEQAGHPMLELALTALTLLVDSRDMPEIPPDAYEFATGYLDEHTLLTGVAAEHIRDTAHDARTINDIKEAGPDEVPAGDEC